MPLDPGISLGVKVPEPGAVNPFGMMGQWADIQNRLNQNRLFQQTFAARQRAGEILATQPDLNSAISALTQDPVTAPFAGETINTLRQAQLALTQQQGEVAKQAQSGLESVMQGIPAAMANPSDWDAIMGQRLKTVSPLARQQVSEAVGALKNSLVHGLPSDPKLAQQVFTQRMIGAATSAGFTPDQLSNLTGKPTTVDTGPFQEFGVQLPAWAGGGFSASTTLPKGLAPQVVTGPFAPGGGQEPVVMGGARQGQVAPVPQQVGGALAPTEAGAGSGPSGNVLGASPAAASAGPGTGRGTSGPQGPSMIQQQYLQARGKAMADYQTNLDDRNQTGALIMQTVQEARDALQNFKPGGGAAAYAKLAKAAQAFGVAPGLVDKIAGGDLGAAQEFQKLMVNTTMSQIKNQLQGVGASRLSQMEFEAFNENNPNIDTDPRAIEKVFNFWTRLYNRDRAEQDALNDYLGKPGADLSKWPAVWQKELVKRGFVTPKEVSVPGPAGAKGPGAAAAAVKRYKFVPGKGIIPSEAP